MKRNHNFIDMTNWFMPEHGVPDSRIIVRQANDTYWIEKGLSRKQVYWDCECLCGNFFTARGEDIRQGKVKSCGCLQKEKSKKICEERRDKYSLVGQRFGKLLVLEDSGNRTTSGNVIWKCLCDCGNITYVSTSNLRGGHVKSCGCMKVGRPSYADKQSYIGQRFVALVVVEHLITDHSSQECLCQCDCGNLHKAKLSDLISGKVVSCGCLKSSGEYIINKILTANNIQFIKEKTYSDCISERGRPLRFDYFINNNFLLEIDGRQHFEASTGGWNNEERLEYTKEHDRIKNEYAKSHNIPIKRIPYTDWNKITLENIMDDTYLIS